MKVLFDLFLCGQPHRKELEEERMREQANLQRQVSDAAREAYKKEQANNRREAATSTDQMEVRR